MNHWVPIAIGAVLTALLFIITLFFPWYTIAFSSSGEITATSYNLPVGSGHAEAREDYYLFKQVNSSSGEVEYRGERLYDWRDSDTHNYVSQKEYRNIFFIELGLVILEGLAFVALVVLLVLGAFGKMGKLPLVAMSAALVLLLIIGSLYLLLALPPAIQDDPHGHLPGSARDRLTRSDQAFAPYGVDNATVNLTVDGVMDVEYTGGIYGSDSGEYQASINGGSLDSASKLSWYPSAGWFAQALMVVLGVGMLMLILRLDLSKKPAAAEGYGPEGL